MREGLKYLLVPPDAEDMSPHPMIEIVALTWAHLFYFGVIKVQALVDEPYQLIPAQRVHVVGRWGDINGHRHDYVEL